MARYPRDRSFTRLEIVLFITVAVLVAAVIVATVQPNPKRSLGSAVFCPGLTNLHGTNKSGSDEFVNVRLPLHKVLCEGQRAVGQGIPKGTVIEAAFETGRRVGIVLISKSTTQSVQSFSTQTLRKKVGWFGDDGYFAPIGNNGLGYAGTQIQNIGGGGGGGDDGGN